MEYKKQLPKTIKVINDIDNMLNKLYGSSDIDSKIEEFSDYEKILFDQLEIAIATTLYYESPLWAVKIAKQILLMEENNESVKTEKTIIKNRQKNS